MSANKAMKCISNRDTDKYYSLSRAEKNSEFSVIAPMHAGGKGQIHEKYQVWAKGRQRVSCVNSPSV